MIIKFPYDGEWNVFDTSKPAWKDAGASSQRDILEHYKKYNSNPLAYFLPHGVPWCDKERSYAGGRLILPPSDYPKEWGNDGAAFLNDTGIDGNIMLGPNQMGKSALLAAWVALNVVKCDPNWECFTRKKAPLVYREWEGPKTWLVASYMWANVQTMWENIRKFFPQYELGPYRIGGEKYWNFRRGGAHVMNLACGSQLMFLSYHQPQAAWEGFAIHGAACDEQSEKPKFIGAIRGMTTTGDHCPFGMALTGHVVEGRSDTGSAGWIKNELIESPDHMGFDVRVRHLSVESTPDAIVSQRKKRQLFKIWADPGVDRSPEMEDEAVARFWGGFQEGGGRVFGLNVWNRRAHVIDPLWDDDKTPDCTRATLYRVIDYGEGQNGIMCCGWFAVTPTFAYLYRMMYEENMLVADAAEKIIELSHNEREFVESTRHPGTGNIIEHYRENMTREVVHRTILDGRSYNNSHQGESIGDLFRRYGVDVGPACTKINDYQFGVLFDWMRINYAVKHPYNEGADGCPKLLMFRNRGCEPVFDELDSLGFSPSDNTKINRKQKHDGIDVLKYWATLDGMGYWGDEWESIHGPGEGEMIEIDEEWVDEDVVF